jgi:hypothetical protein
MKFTMIKHIALGIPLTAAVLLLLGAGAPQGGAHAQGLSPSPGAPAQASSAASASSLTPKGIEAVLGKSGVKSGGDDFLPPD